MFSWLQRRKKGTGMVVLGIVVAVCLGYVVWYVWDISDFASGIAFESDEEGGRGGLPPEDQAPPEGPGSLEAELDRITDDPKSAPNERSLVLR
jgi:hypothetical protein